MAKSKAATGRTRWKRFGVALIPATVVISGMMVGAANGAIPMGFAISGTTFKVKADRLEAEDVVQFGRMTNSKSPNPSILSGFSHAKFVNMCQSVKVPLPISIGGKDSVVMVIKSSKAEAKNLVADLVQMTGQATFNNVAIGIDASTTSKGPLAKAGQAGGFAQEIDNIVVDQPRQVVYSVAAEKFTLENLDISVNFTNEECFS